MRPVELRAQQVELQHGNSTLFRIFGAIDHAFEFRDGAQRLDFGRNESGVLQDAKRRPNVFGYQRVVVEIEWSALTRKIVELAASERFGDSLFGQQVEGEHASCTEAAVQPRMNSRTGRI